MDISPPSPDITIADVPPYNSYTLGCSARLRLPQPHFLTLNFSWFDFSSGTELLSNDTISVQSFTTTTSINDTVFMSELTERVVMERNSVLRKGCSVNVVYTPPLVEGNGAVLAYVRNASKDIVTKGKLQ